MGSGLLPGRLMRGRLRGPGTCDTRIAATVRVLGTHLVTFDPGV